MALAGGRGKLCLDDIVPDEPDLNVVVPEGIGDELLLHPVLQQHAPLHVPGILKAVDHTRLVDLRVLAALLRGALAVGIVSLIDQTTPAIEIKNGAQVLLIVTRQVEKVVEVGARQASALNDGGIFDVRDTRGPPNVEG